MSSNAIDCSMLEEGINNQNLYISTTQDQINKLEPDDPDIQNKRDALNRKLAALNDHLDMLQRALEDCRQGKGANLPPFDIVSEDDAV